MMTSEGSTFSTKEFKMLSFIFWILASLSFICSIIFLSAVMMSSRLLRYEESYEPESFVFSHDDLKRKELSFRSGKTVPVGNAPGN